MFYRYLLLLFIFTIFFQCNKSKKEIVEPEIVLKVLGQNSSNQTKIVFKKNINLDEDPDLESVYILRNVNEEVLAVFKTKNNEKILQFKILFTLLNMGPLEYDAKSKKWIASSVQSSDGAYIFKKVEFHELPGDNFYSIFLEVLSEEPPLGLFSIPYTIRKGEKILDGLKSLKEHENLVKTKRASFEYIAKEKSLKIFPKDNTYSQEFVFNGWELLPKINGNVLPSLLEVELSDKFTAGKEVLVKLVFKNRGTFAPASFLSISFPDGGQIKLIENKPDIKIYPKGSMIYSNREKKYVKSQTTMIEFVKNSWTPNYKQTISFLLNPEKDGKQLVLFRSSSKISNNVISLPNEYSSALAQIDGQGFWAYKLELGN